MTNSTKLIEVKNVSKTYDGGLIQAVTNLSLSLEKGKIYALMGQSGCGKSTLLNMIGTLDLPTSGTIDYEGKRLNALEPLSSFRRDFIGFIFQFHHLIPALTLRGNVEVAMLSNQKISATQRVERTELLLTEMGLAKKIDAYANKISGGERQRGAIARALANDPILILADEPTGSVDTKTSQMILDKLKSHVLNNGGTMLIATHDPLVATIADEIIYMQDGAIVSVEKQNAKSS